MKLQTRSVSLLAGLGIASCIAFLPRFASANPIEALLSGTNTPNFTVTYDVLRHSKLEDEAPEQLDRQVSAYFDERQKLFQSRNLGPLPDSVRQSMDRQVRDLSDTGKNDHYQLTISVSGRRMLVRLYSKKTANISLYVTDGSRSIYGDRGSDFTVESGLDLKCLSSFVFPGFGVEGIPLAKEDAPPPGAQSTKDGTEGGNAKVDGQELLPGDGKVWYVATADGSTAKDGLPQYWPGFIRTIFVGGRACISELYGAQFYELPDGEKGGVGQDCAYWDYRMIAPNLMVPGEINLTHYYCPGQILPYGPYNSIKYRLLNASPTALPDSNFIFENQLHGIGIVYNNLQDPHRVIRYVPGKSLDQQFKEAEQSAKESAMRNAPNRPAGSWTSAVGLLALIAGLTGWVLYKRTTSRS